MIKRPSKADTEEDVLRMQREFLQEKRKNIEFQPSAKVVKLNPTERKPSKFAESRKLKKSSEPKADKVMVGDIVEKSYVEYGSQFEEAMEMDDLPFPKPVKLDTINAEGGSLFAQSMKQPSYSRSMGASNIIQGDYAGDIHQENVRIMETLSEEQILQERQELLSKIDPKLVEFLAKRKKVEPLKSEVVMVNKEEVIEPEPVIIGNSENWLHFDKFEAEKLAWTKDFNPQNLKPGEKFEARFDWKGVLLPYKEAMQEENRDLFLHGDEAHRPGYTLQELFRLSRSNVLQQRLSAINCLAGILNIYNQGFYDGVIELPISKIFFLLRFALDENTPAVIEAASKALAFLFYNESDEILLDHTFETVNGVQQPALYTKLEIRHGEELAETLSQLKLSDTPFASEINDDDFDKDTINDFHLAEVDLINCILRTNILERVRYVFFTVKPEEATVVACVKILIRLARTNKEIATQILNLDGFMVNFVQLYLPAIDEMIAENQGSYAIILKLLRVIAASDVTAALKLERLMVLDKAKSYIFSRNDINTKLVQVQIECFRYLRTHLTLINNEQLFQEFVPAIRYILEWHYQNLQFTGHTQSYLVKQHAAAVLNLLQCGNIVTSFPVFVDVVEICLCKWFSAGTKNGVDEFSQKLLLGTCLNVATKFVKNSANQFTSFIESYFRLFLESESFSMLTKAMCSAQQRTDRSFIHSALPNLGSILVRNTQNSPNLLFSQEYPVHLLQSIGNFLEHIQRMEIGKFRQLIAIFHNEHIKRHIVQSLSEQNTVVKSLNWFNKIEVLLMLNILKINNGADVIDKRVQLQLAYFLLNRLSQELVVELQYLFDEIAFNIRYFSPSMLDHNILQRYRNVYMDTILAALDANKFSGKSLFVYEWRASLLVPTWPYHLLTIFLNLLTTNPNEQNDITKDFPEDEIIQTVFGYTNILEENGIHLLSPTEKLMYLMIGFIGPESKFLETHVRHVLQKGFETLPNAQFDLELKLEGKITFERLYALFVEAFESSSYGDELFSIMLMIPLAHKYDVKWRRRFWSEHCTALRFVTCTEAQLLGGIDSYLTPAETELSLLKCYSQAINSNILRKGTVPYKIAEHHVTRYRVNQNKQTETARDICK